MARILIVDDTQLIREGAARLLTKAGHSVSQASDGEEAMVFMTLNPDVDLIISDFKMPNIDGVTFFLWVIKEFPEMAKNGFAFHTSSGDELPSAIIADIPIIGKPGAPGEFMRVVNILLK